MSQLVAFLAHPLFVVTQALVQRFGLCELCGKNELCWGGKCLACCKKRGDDRFEAIDRLATQFDTFAPPYHTQLCTGENCIECSRLSLNKLKPKPFEQALSEATDALKVIGTGKVGVAKP